jgi:transposase-like protein
MSMAAVALEHGLNANLLRRWVVADERACAAGLIEPRRAVQVPSVTANAAFVPLEIGRAGAVTSQEIVIELRRGATLVKVSWPVEAAPACGSWLRDLLR